MRAATSIEAGQSNELLCTLGPASLNKPTIRRLDELGATLFRLNMSHVAIDQLAEAIELIQEATDVPVCIDTEGAQVRTAKFSSQSVELSTAIGASISRLPVLGTAETFNLYPDHIFDELERGDILSIDFDSALVQVLSKNRDEVQLRVLSGGVIGNNKAVSVHRPIVLPPLTEKDRNAIETAARYNIRHYALSFANRPEDVELLRDLVGPDSYLISKIECRMGLRNLREIADLSDAILIDRGDLSREVPIEQIPRIQKAIIRTAKRSNRKAYVATNLLESMVVNRSPSRAEINDIFNTLEDGADGLVLAAETAIGQHPIRCAAMVVRMMSEQQSSEPSDDHLPRTPQDLLIRPHGGTLIQRHIVPDDMHSIDDLPVLRISETDKLDCEQLAYGTYSPLTGFMDSKTLDSVLSENCLLDGTVWSLPILLQFSAAQVRAFGVGDRIALTTENDDPHSVLDVSEIYRLDLETLAVRWFGTASTDHPGVRRFFAAGDYAVGGSIQLLSSSVTEAAPYSIRPADSRLLFTHNQWSKVIGFHSRNVCHRAHEFIQTAAMEQIGADGLYITPVTGPAKQGDFLPSSILLSYQTLMQIERKRSLDSLLGTFSTFPRYAGPREAAFTALCRKNMGCSHFIIGRDHTGVGGFYPADANRRYMDDIGDIGIVPIYFEPVGYNPMTGVYEAGSDASNLKMISGTEFREALVKGERVPDWFVRDEIQNALIAEVRNKRQLFQA